MEQVDSDSQLEVEEGNDAPPATNRKLKSLSLENKRLKLLVILFAILSLLATAGLIAGVVIAVRQTRKANKITQQEPPKPEKIVTTIYYFNDDEKEEPTPLPGNGIIDPIPVNDNDAIGLDEDGSFVITAEDLANSPETEESPNTVVITIDP